MLSPMLKRLLVATLFAISLHAAAQTVPPRTFVLNAGTLAQLKAHPDAALLAAVRADADRALRQEVHSIIEKKTTPPSGDKHDYMSMGRYFWPNPNTPNHLPYIRKDGQSNPEIKDITDHEYLSRMGETVRALGLGYYLTGEAKYAERAAKVLRVWFLDPATAMKPNMDYAQAVPGVNTGRGSGILDSRNFAMTIDGVGLLAGSTAWSAADNAALQKWFADYDHWLMTAKEAKHEDNAPNNHGSWFQVQAASIARFLGHDDEARAIGVRARDQRIPAQFDKDGMQKYELTRTNSFSYSAFNLEALTELASIVGPLGVDLYTPALLKGMDALLPFDKDHKWTHEQIGADMEGSVCPALVRIGAHTGDAKYADAEKRFDCKFSTVQKIEMLRPRS
jgi:hypothetical protein